MRGFFGKAAWACALALTNSLQNALPFAFATFDFGVGRITEGVN